MRRNRKKKLQKNKLFREPRGMGQQYTEDSETNPYLKEVILEVVENQLRENNPPETRQTFERLLALGYSRQEAVEMIGSAVVEEIWAVLQEEKPFDPIRYKASLDKLS